MAKVYVLVRWDYNSPMHSYAIWDVYSTTQKAEAAKKKEEARPTTEPFEEDSYGPLRGHKFEIMEYEVLG